MPYLNDVGVKGPTSTYNNEETLPGIRRYMLEHFQNLNAVLADIERAGGIIVGGKSNFIEDSLGIMGYVCDGTGRHPDRKKVEKILD